MSCNSGLLLDSAPLNLEVKDILTQFRIGRDFGVEQDADVPDVSLIPNE